MGIPFFDETRQVLKKHENVYADVAFTASYDDVRSFAERHGMEAVLPTREIWRATLAALINEFGCERILYGSDFPFVRPRTALDEFLQLSLSDDTKEKILLENARRVLRL